MDLGNIIRWGETAAAVRVLYAVGLIMFSFGGVPTLAFLDTHQTSHLVSGIVIAALGTALLALATVGYRRLPGAERRAIFGNAKQSERAGIVAAAMLAVSGGIQVWLAFTPDVGPKALPIAVLSFGLAALYLVAARRKRRLSSPESRYQRDIGGASTQRYFDGTKWTDQLAPFSPPSGPSPLTPLSRRPEQPGTSKSSTAVRDNGGRWPGRGNRDICPYATGLWCRCQRGVWLTLI